ncbi:MAG: transcriptional regulator [Hydrogenophaga sp.]|nr:transcriptional regulator [Hydrogenophaga sp.]
MNTFADSLKKEIARVARKELREEIAALRKSSGLQRSEIATLKKQLKGVQAQVNKLAKGRAAHVPSSSREVKTSDAAEQPRLKPGRKVVFSAERLKTQRARLGFTQEQMGKLLDVSALSIWKWESGGAAPRAARVPSILERIALGKREALAVLGTSGE